MRRWHLSVCATTSGNKSRIQPKELTNVISKFHLEQRVFQLSELNDREYGYASPYAVFNRDQVPLQCSAEMAKTVNEKGQSVIWNVLWNPDEKYRFATMNLTIPMRVLWDRDKKPLNLPFVKAQS
jgi:hypothetical protein